MEADQLIKFAFWWIVRDMNPFSSLARFLFFTCTLHTVVALHGEFRTMRLILLFDYFLIL